MMTSETPNQIIPAPRRRKGGPKVKTGCQTCKIRRVKCDEAKPSCKRCVSTGRRCDGYATDLKRLSPEVQSVSEIQRIPTLLPGTVEERRAFQYFVSNTATELSGYFDSSFWEHLILQASVTEPSLRYAILDAWNISFENFMRSQSHTFDSKQLRAAALCKIHYTTVHIICRVTEPDLGDTRSIKNSYNDPKKAAVFEPEFQAIVSLAKSLINATGEDAKAGKPPFTFSADLGLVAPLYLHLR
ncbi:hypothetical protein EYC84_007411 [Monilinia fructicola]|uniref:Zn(2)-C6 fungal-type domain-containing protein n=1 Tax=Monilinia fructicola TaxID=38448 RepID=A0A5M9JMX6_MONFR|nr:hypothetical protein EYC84_007411 [Monilinia fructicola]